MKIRPPVFSAPFLSLRHHKEGIGDDPQEGDDHVTPKQVHISTFREAHVAENDEERRLHKEQDGRGVKLSREKHQSDDKGPKTEDAKHAVHGFHSFQLIEPPGGFFKGVEFESR